MSKIINRYQFFPRLLALIAKFAVNVREATFLKFSRRLTLETLSKDSVLAAYNANEQAETARG